MPRVTYMTGSVPATLPREAPAPSASREAAWAEAVARLAQSHRARLAEPDPTRPWLSTAVLAPDPDLAGRPDDPA